MTDYAGSASYHATIDVPSDSDRRNMTKIRGCLEYLQDGVQYLRSRMAGAADTNIIVPGIKGGYSSGEGTVWTFGANAGPYWSQGTGSQSLLMWDLSPYLPNVCKISDFRVYVQAASGHSALPSTMPALKLMRRQFADAPNASWVDVDSQVDTSGNTSAYQAGHTIRKYGLAHSYQVSAGWLWALGLSGEGGSNFIAGLAVLRPMVVITP